MHLTNRKKDCKVTSSGRKRMGENRNAFSSSRLFLSFQSPKLEKPVSEKRKKSSSIYIWYPTILPGQNFLIYHAQETCFKCDVRKQFYKTIWNREWLRIWVCVVWLHRDFLDRKWFMKWGAVVLENKKEKKRFRLK